MKFGVPYAIGGKTYEFQYWGYRVAMRFFATESKTVDKIYVRVSTINGTSPTYRFGVQKEVNSQPSGSFLGSTTVKPAATGWLTADIANVDLVGGTIYYIVIQWESGTIDGSNNVEFNTGYVDPWITNIKRLIPTTELYINDPYLQFFEYNGTIWYAVHLGGDPYYPYMMPFILEYTDSTYFGKPYYDGGSATSIYGTAYAGEEIIMHTDRTIKELIAMFSSPGSPEDDLYVSIYNVTDSAYLVNSELFVTKAALVTGWNSHTLSSKQTLRAGKKYQIFFSSPSTTAANKYRLHYNLNDSDTPALETSWRGDSNVLVTGGAVPLPTRDTTKDAKLYFELAPLVGAVTAGAVCSGL